MCNVISNYDPFGLGKYRYSFRQECREVPGYELGDGSHTIILNNRGTNPDEVPEELVSFLRYTRADLEESQGEYEDEYVRELQEKIRQIKASREMGGLYMTFQEMLNEEREEGRKQGRIEGCKEGRMDERRRWINYLKDKGMLTEAEAVKVAEEITQEEE